MKLRNKKTGEIGFIEHNILTTDPLTGETLLTVRYKDDSGFNCYKDYATIKLFNEQWEDYTPAEPLIKDEKICKIVREWAEYNETESVEVYNLVYDHGGVCIENALVRFYDPRLRTNIDVWFKKFEAPIFEDDREYTLSELCGEKEE